MSLMATLGMDVSNFQRGTQAAKAEMAEMETAAASMGGSVKLTAQHLADLKEVSKMLSDGLRGAGTVLTAAFTVPLAAIGAAGLKAGVDLDNAFDNIRTKTGATGSALEGLQNSFRTVFAGVPASAEEVSQAIASISQRTGQTGPALEALTTQFLNLSRITGESLGPTIRNTTRLFGDWNVEAGKQSTAMDMLFRVTQQTGIGYSTLSAKLVQAGEPLRQLGFSFEQAAVMVGKFEKTGVETELVLGAMKAALGKFGKAGDEPAEAFKRVTDAIKNSSVEIGNNIALQLVGTKRMADFAGAIRTGKLDFDELTASVRNSKETINGATADTEDFAESWIKFKNNMVLALEPLGKELFRVLNDLTPKLKAVADLVADATRAFGAMPEPLRTIALVAGAVLGAGGPLLLGMGSVVSKIPQMQAGLASLGTSFAGLASGIAIAAGAFALFATGKALYDWARASDDVKSANLGLESQLRKLDEYLKSHGITVERGGKTLDEWSVALNKAAREMPAYTGQLAANTRGQLALAESGNMTAKQMHETATKMKAAGDAASAMKMEKLANEMDVLAVKTGKAGGAYDLFGEAAKKAAAKAAEEYKKLQAAIKSAQEHFELFMSKFNGATWDLGQFRQFVNEGGNVNSALKEIETQLVKLKQKFGDDIPPAIKSSIVQLTLARTAFLAFQDVLNAEKRETILDEMEKKVGQIHEKFKGLPPVILEVGKAVETVNFDWERMDRIVQDVSIPIKELPEAIQATVDATARAASESGALWRKLGDDIKGVFRDLKSEIGRSIGGSIWDSIIGNNNNAQLDKEAAQVRANLEKSAAEWERYQQEVQAQITAIGESHAAELEQELADLRRALAEKQAEYEAFASDAVSKLEGFRAAQDNALNSELLDLAQNLAARGEEWEQYKSRAASGFAEFTAKQDAELQTQITGLLGNLAQRGDEWINYRDKTLETLGQFTAKQDAQLASELAKLKDNLEERAADWAEYQAEAISRLEDFRQAQDEKLADERADLQRSLESKREDYNDYVASVNEKLATLQETSEEKLKADLERLQESFDEKREAYGQYVEDVNQKLNRIGEDVAESIDDERRDTERGIADKQRAYDREEREINERIQRELAKGSSANHQQVRDWRRSLEDKRTDLDLYLARAKEDFEEYTADHQRQAARQTSDLQAELAERAAALATAQTEYTDNVAEVTNASRTELQRQTDDLIDSLTDRTEDWTAYQAEIATKMATAQTNHDTAITNEETKVRNSLAERQASWTTYQAEIAAKVAEAQRAHDEAIAGEAQKVATSLSERQAAWEAYRLEIERKIASAHAAHDTAIATEAGKVQASLNEREAAWIVYQASIAAKITAAQEKHDEAIAAEELKVQLSLGQRAIAWLQYQAANAAAMEAATRKHDQEQAKEVADLITRMDEKRAEYDKFVADIKAKLEQIERDHTTVWGRIGSSILETLSGAGRAITQMLFESLTTSLFDKLKASGVWKEISDFLSGVFQNIGSILSDIFGKVADAIGGVFSGIFQGTASSGGGIELPTIGTPSRGGGEGSNSGLGGGGISVGTASGAAGVGAGIGTLIAGPLGAAVGAAIGGAIDLIRQTLQQFSIARTESDIAEIEKHTRWMKDANRDTIIPLYNLYLPKLKGLEDFNNTVLGVRLKDIYDEVIDKGLAIVGAINSMKEGVLGDAKGILHDMALDVVNVAADLASISRALGASNNQGNPNGNLDVVTALLAIRDLLMGIRTATTDTATSTANFSTTNLEGLIQSLGPDIGSDLSALSAAIGTSFRIDLNSSLGTAVTNLQGSINTLRNEFDDIDFTDVGTMLTNFSNTLSMAIVNNNPVSAINDLKNQMVFYGSQQLGELVILRNRPVATQQTPIVNVSVVNTATSISSQVRQQGVFLI